MKKANRFIENFDKIKEIGREKNVDLEIASMMFVKQEKLENWSKEKEIFDVAYKNWAFKEFKGELSDYLKKGE